MKTELSATITARQKIIEIAEKCHAVNGSVKQLMGEEYIPWNESSDDVRKSAIDGVMQVVNNPNMTPADIHDKWCKYKVKQGWKYGEERSDEEKTHPGLVSFHDLSKLDQLKDVLFIATAKTLLS